MDRGGEGCYHLLSILAKQWRGVAGIPSGRTMGMADRIGTIILKSAKSDGLIVWADREASGPELVYDGFVIDMVTPKGWVWRVA